MVIPSAGTEYAKEDWRIHFIDCMDSNLSFFLPSIISGTEVARHDQGPPLTNVINYCANPPVNANMPWKLSILMAFDQQNHIKTKTILHFSSFFLFFFLSHNSNGSIPTAFYEFSRCFYPNQRTPSADRMCSRRSAGG